MFYRALRHSSSGIPKKQWRRSVNRSGRMFYWKAVYKNSKTRYASLSSWSMLLTISLFGQKPTTGNWRMCFLSSRILLNRSPRRSMRRSQKEKNNSFRKSLPKTWKLLIFTSAETNMQMGSGMIPRWKKSLTLSGCMNRQLHWILNSWKPTMV